MRPIASYLVPSCSSGSWLLLFRRTRVRFAPEADALMAIRGEAEDPEWNRALARPCSISACWQQTSTGCWRVLLHGFEVGSCIDGPLFRNRAVITDQVIREPGLEADPQAFVTGWLGLRLNDVPRPEAASCALEHGNAASADVAGGARRGEGELSIAACWRLPNTVVHDVVAGQISVYQPPGGFRCAWTAFGLEGRGCIFLCAGR